METGRRTKAPPTGGSSEEELGPHSPCGHNTNKPERRTSKQPHKTTTHRVCLRCLRSCDSRPGALRLGPWQSNVVAAAVSSDRRPIRGSSPALRWPSRGLRPPPRLAESLLLSNMPTRSPTVSQQASHSRTFRRPLPRSLSPPARWDPTHARCLINTEMCQRRLVHCKAS